MRTVAPFPLEVTDRMAFTVCLAIVVHLIIILGIGFSFPRQENPKSRHETLEVVLVERASKRAPEDAALLAQHNYVADQGGLDDEGLAGLLPAPFPNETPAITAPPEMAATPELAQSVDAEPSALAPGQLTVPPETEPEAPPPQATKQDADASAIQESVPEQISTPPVPSARELISRSFEIAALASEIKRKLRNKSQRPRRKFISASTREYKYAAYMESWRHKVELFGNLNYPEDVRRRGLSGSLILEVALKPDGSLHEIIVRKSSGSRVLDDAAVRIVRLASPYASFPKQIRGETDILHITRTWQFLGDRSFR